MPLNRKAPVKCRCAGKKFTQLVLLNRHLAGAQPSALGLLSAPALVLFFQGEVLRVAKVGAGRDSKHR